MAHKASTHFCQPSLPFATTLNSFHDLHTPPLHVSFLPLSFTLCVSLACPSSSFLLPSSQWFFWGPSLVQYRYLGPPPQSHFKCIKATHESQTRGGQSGKCCCMSFNVMQSPLCEKEVKFHVNFSTLWKGPESVRTCAICRTMIMPTSHWCLLSSQHDEGCVPLPPRHWGRGELVPCSH